MSSELNKNNMELETPLKQRLYQLMTDDEKLLPFSFANRIGIGKSTFHSIWTKGSTSIHRSTAKKIADATGVDVDWLHKGVGVPYPHEGRVIHPKDGTEFDHLPKELTDGLKQEQARQSARTADEVIQEGFERRLGFNPDYIADALDILDEVEANNEYRMSNDKKAELIIMICSALNIKKESQQHVLKALKEVAALSLQKKIG